MARKDEHGRPGHGFPGYAPGGCAHPPVPPKPHLPPGPPPHGLPPLEMRPLPYEPHPVYQPYGLFPVPETEEIKETIRLLREAGAKMGGLMKSLEEVNGSLSDLTGSDSGLGEEASKIETIVQTCETLSDLLVQIGTAIQNVYNNLSGRLDTLETSHTALENRVGALETNYTALEKRVTTLEGCCEIVQQTLDNLEERVRKLEEGGTASPEPEQVDFSIEVTLEDEPAENPDRTIKFIVEPTGALLTLNGERVILTTSGTYSITAKDGDEISWSCEKDGYVSQSGSHTVNGDATVTITLEEEPAETKSVDFEIGVSLED